MMEITNNSVDSVRLLEVKNLRTSFFTSSGEVKAVDDVSYYLDKQEVVALVGESGCGKSVSQMSVMQLVQDPPGKILGGEVLLNGKNLLEYSSKSKEMRSVRGAKIAMVFQEPMTSLNPVLTIGSQLSEIIRVHIQISKKEAWEKGIEALESVGISDAARRMKNYPFELSGGMRQRVMIAIAIACRSELIIADEPTTALDVTTQAQVMDLLLTVVKNFKTALLIVTHNLGLVTRYARRIYVMYAGKVIESGTTEALLTHPRHPYTAGLLKSVPRLDGEQAKKLVPIEGAPPNLASLPPVCAFLPRCQYAGAECKEKPFPTLRLVGEEQHFVACHLDLAGGDRK
jgi:oligopeptide/dipeptide ABC transporter ATP-binding protein